MTLGIAFLEMLGLEIWLHFFYHYAFNESGLWYKRNFSPFEVMATGYWTLNFMYTKFLVIWKFFRTVALLDGIETPENMNRCVNNNFTFTGFWRSWHGSLNQWIVRYMYLPLGGRKTQVFTLGGGTI
jgi:D-alanyl-lipoteichoic acid acyltransferase DltB (MBOAT superfamily)